MKILFLNKFYYLKGGAERVFFEEQSVLQQKGQKIIPFSRRHPGNLPTQYNDFFAPQLSLDTHPSFKSLKAAFGIIYSFQTKAALRRLISQERPDIAHAHNIYGLLTTSVLDELYSSGIPAVLTLHDFKIICPNYQFLNGTRICQDCKTHHYYKAILNKCVHGNMFYSSVYALENYFHYMTRKYEKKVSRYIAVSRFIRNKFIEYGFPEERITLIPNFIDAKLYEPAYENQNYFLYFGRLVPEKGLMTLLRAFARLKTTQNRLIIAGEGPLRRELEKEIIDQNINNVEFTGFLTGDLLADKIKKCVCTIIPSEIYENCPMSALESLAYGKPVIGADIGGIPELITHKVDGLIFKSGDVEDLSNCLEYMASQSPLQLREWGTNARMKIERSYNVKQHYEALMTLYHEVLH
ncbi:MAG TPA: glycosyltransferase family 4 protein [Smithella sp.]|nr:glycosyltransferase family 4 protein [Smithella sp.]